MRTGQTRKRDAVEPSIVKALRQAGADVCRLSGPGLPDLLVRHRSGQLFAFEVKGAKGRRTAAQRETHWPIVRTADEALDAIGQRRLMKRSE